MWWAEFSPSFPVQSCARSWAILHSSCILSTRDFGPNMVTRLTKEIKTESASWGFDLTLVRSVLRSMFGKWAKMGYFALHKVVVSLEDVQNGKHKFRTSCSFAGFPTKQGQWGNREYYDAATATSPAAAAVSYPATQCMIMHDRNYEVSTK